MRDALDKDEYSIFVAHYLEQITEEGELSDIYRSQSDELIARFGRLSEEQAGYRYAEGKWSVKEVLGHLTDSVQIFSYRLLCLARGESQPLPGFEENLYVREGRFDAAGLDTLLARYRTVRDAALALAESLPEEAMMHKGIVNGNPLSARAQWLMLIGHERHHIRILEERYGV
ncbi:DinB family protein [Paenibacillus spiritus]|uniref:DinB family protein n=1 Tax=Paenibacillus spiritus TaxID=2496557 RepID=A0A5J5GHA1_9BACL|nr:DinB family protein [Paenibacillus spiritus]KAA9007457.1 DinB family protein [Paenibacillus spiritus]